MLASVASSVAAGRDRNRPRRRRDRASARMSRAMSWRRRRTAGARRRPAFGRQLLAVGRHAIGERHARADRGPPSRPCRAAWRRRPCSAAACPAGTAGWCRSDTRRRRAARCGAAPGRSRRPPRSAMRLLHRLRLEHDVGELDVFARRSAARPWSRAPCTPSMYSSVTAPRSVERRRAERLELLLHPAGADAQREPAPRQHVHASRASSPSAPPGGAAPPSPR